MIAKKLTVLTASAALTAAVATGACLGSGAATAAEPPAQAATTQTIDAKTDPAAAAKAMNDFCQVLSNCQFVGTVPIKVDYDANRILGDALYNCGQAEAEDEVALSDERSESWSFEESVSTKVKLGFIGLAKSSVEAEIKSGQLDEAKTTLKQSNGVSVGPGELGYTETRVPTAYLTGSAYITDGVNIYNVTNIALTYPGYGNQALTQIDWTSQHDTMTPQDRQSHCAGLPALYPITAARVGGSSAAPRILVCTAVTRRCTHPLRVAGIAQQIPAETKLTLARGRVVYATGKVGRNRTILRSRHRLRRGAYTLLLSERHASTVLQVSVR